MDDKNQPLIKTSVQKSKAEEGYNHTKIGCQRRCQLNSMLTIMQQAHIETNKRRPRSLMGSISSRDSAFLLILLLLANYTLKICCKTNHEHFSPVESQAPTYLQDDPQRIFEPTNWRVTQTATSQQHANPLYLLSRSKRSSTESHLNTSKRESSSTKSPHAQTGRAKSSTESSRSSMISRNYEGFGDSPENDMKNIIQRLEENQNLASRAFNQSVSVMHQHQSQQPLMTSKRKQKRGDNIIRSEVPMATQTGNLADFNTANSSQSKSRSMDHPNERIDIKHRYTFTVNGKELSLQPPVASSLMTVDLSPSGGGGGGGGGSGAGGSSLSESTQPTTKASGERRKLNRIGDFISQDYETGFEVNGAPLDSESSPQTSPTSSQTSSRQYSINSGVTKGRLSSSAQSALAAQAALSTSSSLMSPSRHNGEDKYAENDDLPFSSAALSTSYENNISPSRVAERNHELGKQQDNSLDFTSGNKIISDWPKSDNNKQLSTKSDRHSSKSGNSLSALANDKAQATKIQNQGSSGGGGGGSKFSTDFKLANNEGANQSGEQHQQAAPQQAWDFKQQQQQQPIQAHISSSKPPKIGTNLLVSAKSSTSTDTSPSSRDHDSSSYKKASSKRNIYPRAPVYAKARYSTPVEPVQSQQDVTATAPNGGGLETSGGIVGSKSTSAKESNQRRLVKVDLGDLKESNFQTNDDSRANSHLHNQARQNLASIPNTAPTSKRSNELTTAVRSARFDRSMDGPIIPKSLSNIDLPSKVELANGAPNSVERTFNSNSISEYKSNLTAQQAALSVPTHAQQKRLDNNSGTLMNHDSKSETVKKSHIVQRDLSSKMAPFSPSAFIDSSRGGFKPSEPKLFNSRNFGKLQNQIDSLKSIISNDSTGGTNSLQRISAPDNNNNNNRYTNDRSIVRTGPILPNPMASYSQLKALMPGLFMRDAQDDYQAQAATNQFRAMLAGHSLASSGSSAQLLAGNDYQPYGRATSSSSNQNLSGADQMLATSNQHSVAHLGPRTAMGNSMGESSNYNSIASLQDYPERPMPNHDQIGNNQESGINANNQASNNNNIPGDEHSRGGYSETDQNSFEPNASVRSSTQNAAPSEQTTTNSRSSVSDVYLRTEHKNRGDPASPYPIRGSGDPFEDLAGGLSTSEYERDLADLDEEFNRQSSYRRPSNPLMSDSFMTMSPERYEARRYNRRPTFDYTGDYLNTAGSISSIIPRPYQRSHASPWPSSSTYSDNSDLWADTNVDYNPLASFVSPNHYAYRWRPRYQRVSPYSTSPYLTTSASEQHLQPAYNIVPSYTSAAPTETITYALSPLAAAAAAAASALVAADKTRHQNHGWLALPRLTASSAISPTPTTASASTQHASSIPAGAIQTAYIHRPNPYALGSVPIYAIAPRPPAPLTTAASGATASYIPYFHHGAAPTLIAYRPASVMPSASLLAAHSFAYPLRLPVSTIHRPGGLTIAAPTRTVARPFYSDLAFAESKSKTNLTSTSTEGKGIVRAGSLTAMAKNLTKKMFGSASQIRPQHVAPPSTIFDQYTPSQNSSSINLSSSVPTS